MTYLLLYAAGFIGCILTIIFGIYLENEDLTIKDLLFFLGISFLWPLVWPMVTILVIKVWFKIPNNWGDYKIMRKSEEHE